MSKGLFTVLVMGLAIAGFSSVADAQCADPPAGMVAWWPLDETVGVKATDIAGSVANDGTWHGVPTPVVGNVKGALRFDLDTQFVEVPDHPELNFGTGSLTIDAWIQTNTTSGIQVIVDKRGGPEASPIGYVFFLINGVLGFQLDDGEPFTGNIWTTGPILTDGAWHHVAVTVARPSGLVQFYANGALLVRDPASSPILVPGDVSNGASLQIGNRRTLSGPAPFHGSIDELELFNRALNPLEINAIFTAGNLGKCKPLCLIGSGGVLGQIFDIAPETGAASNVRGGVGEILDRIAFSPDGKLYGITSDPNFANPDNLVTIDPATGAIVGTPVALPFILGSGFAIDPSTGVFYVNDFFNNLYAIDPKTGILADVGLMDVFPDCTVSGLAFDGVDLYAVTPGGCFFEIPPKIYRVDKSDATTTHIADINPVSVYSIQFDPLTRELYCSNGVNLFRMLPATGALMTIGSIGIATYALAFVPRVCSRVTAVETALSLAHMNALGQNRPNPFNPATTIPYSLATPGHIALRIYDVAGRLIRTLVDRVQVAGTYSARWDGRSDSGGRVASSIYFYRITYPGGARSVKKMAIMR